MSDRINRKLIAYGAGEAAKKNIGLYADIMGISEIWDNYSNEVSLDGIPVNRPRESSSNEIIIVFIDKENVRETVIHHLMKLGHRYIFYYMDIDRLRWQAGSYRIRNTAGNAYRYDLLAANHVPVLFMVFDQELQNERLHIPELKDQAKEELLICLDEKISIRSGTKEEPKRVKEEVQGAKEELQGAKEELQGAKGELERAIETLIQACEANLYEFACALETLIYQIVKDGGKTKERLIRMEGDQPYDMFAVTESLDIIFSMLYRNCARQAEETIHILCRAMPSVPPKILLCKFLTRNGRYDEALKLARKMMHERPNDFSINENFYQVALESKRNGFEVPEPLPNYDLGEVFCWCGMDYVWCGGMDEQEGRPLFAPCFRVTCAAKPEGEFNTGEEWKEFRRSLLDGSFRYCQKNQCPNLVGRWLPEKRNCDDPIMKRLIDGEEEVKPLIRELHFSYDTHCNLICPSCRTERCMNSAEETEKMNAAYDSCLKPYVARAEHLCLSGCGEALVSDHGRHILTSVSGREYEDLAIELRTNITALNQNTWTSLGESRKRIRHIAASVDGIGEVFEELRYPAKWDLVSRNLEFISSLRRAGEIDLFEIHVVAQRRNIHQLFDIVMLASDLGADAVTFSKIVNWRGMSEKEYDEKNPFWTDSPDFRRLSEELDRIDEFRRNTEKGRIMYINMHFRPDPDAGYEKIRMGRLKIR